jgi:hypothetical protein
LAVGLMVARQLLIVTALVETATGLMLLVSPTLVVAFLLGASIDTPAALVVARMAGAAVLSLGCACWLARNDGPNRAVAGLVAAMLLYNAVAVAVLANAGAGARLVGVLTWPAVAVHAALAVWCIACLRSERRRRSSPPPNLTTDRFSDPRSPRVGSA